MARNSGNKVNHSKHKMATKAQSSIRLPGAASSGPVVLSPVEREIVCAVLEDSINQLAILGGIMPDYASSAAAVEQASTVAMVSGFRSFVTTKPHSLSYSLAYDI